MLKLATKEECIGCTACASICPKKCIKMLEDEDGFFYPIIDTEKCIECNQCGEVCPIANSVEVVEKDIEVYAAYCKDIMVRMSSSSGGIFTELAKSVIKDGGVVYGATYDKHQKVRHICVTSEFDLEKLRGAKYSQSDLRENFCDIKKQLDVGRMVLFTGTPCQVAGLQSFLKKDYNNLVTVDFVCHGVPSPMVWKSYVEYRAKSDANGEIPKNINLRSKCTGWSRYRYSNVFEYPNKKKYTILSSDSLFMKLFVGDYISRTSCGNCKFKGYYRVSDITLGDFWGIWDIDPEMDDNKGTSVVLVQSEKGKMLWKKIDKKIIYKRVTLEQASQQNPSMLISSKLNSKRKIVLDMIRDGHIEECEQLFVYSNSTILNKIKEKIKRFLHI